MFTTLGEFKRQKKSKKKGFVRHAFTFEELYVGRGMEDADPASEAKGFVLVDKKNQSTSVYLDTNENGKLNKGKDLLIASDDGFKKTLYKKRKAIFLLQIVKRQCWERCLIYLAVFQILSSSYMTPG